MLDVAPVLFLGAIGAGSLLLLPPPLASTRPLLTVLVGVSAAVLLLRRRHPVIVFAVVAACLLTQWVVGIPVGPVDFVILVALYAVAGRGSRRWALAALMVGLVGAVMSWLGPLGVDTRRPLTGLIAPAVVVLAVYALGRNAHVRAAYLLTLEERAERLEGEQQATAGPLSLRNGPASPARCTMWSRTGWGSWWPRPTAPPMRSPATPNSHARRWM